MIAVARLQEKVNLHAAGLGIACGVECDTS